MTRVNPMRALGAMSRSSASSSVRPAQLPTIASTALASRQTTLLPSNVRKGFHSQPSLLRRQESAPDTSTRADIAELDVLSNVTVPSTNIEATLPRGFLLNSGLGIFDGAGALLAGGEAFAWRPWLAKPEGEKQLHLLNAKGQIELPAEAFSLFSLLWPRPDLLVIGVGPTIRPLSPETRRHLGALGMRLEVLDTRNAAAQFNLLAMERGIDDIAGAMIPHGWVEGKGAVEEE